MIEINKIYNADCLNLMQHIDDKSIDMILCDLPYGTTACHWDIVIPFDKLWVQYERIIKDNGAIVLTGSEPFSSYLRMSNIKLYKYDVIWIKERATNFMQGARQFLKYHENISIFYKTQCIFNPIYDLKPEKNKRNNKPRNFENAIYNCKTEKYSERTKIGGAKNWNYPKSFLNYSMQRGLHPTQKPVKLFEYLIRTYTNENELVLDNCIGSGTTAIACINSKRNYIGIELDENYYNIANKRVSDRLNQIELF